MRSGRPEDAVSLPPTDATVQQTMLEHSLRSVAPAVGEALGIATMTVLLLARSGVDQIILAAWFTAMVINLAIYALMLRRISRGLAAGLPPARMVRWLFVVQAIAGCCWGAGGFLRVGGDVNAPGIVLAALLIIATGNLIYSASTPVPFLAMHLPLCGLSAVGLAAGGDWFAALMMCIIGVGALPLSSALHRTVLGAVQLARQNAILADEVRSQQVELERINLGLTEANIELSHRATRDPLTGLANRVLFDEHLAETLHRARRDQRVVSVLFFDLDRFKHVNDTYGHAIGDALLRAVSRRVDRQLHGDELLARRGGDEFTAVCVAADGREAVALAERILACFAGPFELDGQVLQVTASIGVAADPGAISPPELVALADAALYRAKQLGRNQVQAVA